MGKNQLHDEQLPKMLMTMRILLLSMIMGVVGFGTFVLLKGPAEDPQGNIVILLVAAAASILLRFIVPGLVVQAHLRQLVRDRARNGAVKSEGLDHRLATIYMTRMIVAAALLEGPAFMVWIGYMLGGFLPCAIVGGLLVFGLLADFPTRNRLLVFIDNQKQRLKDQQLFG